MKGSVIVTEKQERLVKVLLVVFGALVLLALIMYYTYSTGTLIFSTTDKDLSDVSYEEKEHTTNTDLSWELNETYIVNHLPEEVLKNTQYKTENFTAIGDSYDTLWSYIRQQGDDINLENITQISAAFSFGTYSVGEKKYYVTDFNSTYLEDGTFTVLRYERK